MVLICVILVKRTKERSQGSDRGMIEPDFGQFRVGVPDLTVASFFGKIDIELDDVFEQIHAAGMQVRGGVGEVANRSGLEQGDGSGQSLGGRGGAQGYFVKGLRLVRNHWHADI